MALRGALTHRKTRWLADALGIKLPYALGLMEALWHLTSEQTPTGAIGEISDKAIAAEMYWDEDPAVLIEALVKSEILDRDPKHRLIVHGWAERADQTTKRKVARSGKTMVGCDEQRLDMASHELDTYSLPVASSQKPEPEKKQQHTYEDVPLQPRPAAAAAEAFAEEPSGLELFGPDAGREPPDGFPKLTAKQDHAVRILTAMVFGTRDYATYREGLMWRKLFAEGLTPAIAKEVIEERLARPNKDGTKFTATTMTAFERMLADAAQATKAITATRTHTEQPPWEAAGLTQQQWADQLVERQFSYRERKASETHAGLARREARLLAERQGVAA